MLLDMSTPAGEEASERDGGLMSNAEARKTLRRSPRTLERYRKAGYLRVARKDPISRRVWFRADEVADLARRLNGEGVA